uniref:Uncharacterized protein n=1 Tax=Anopheles christyi TaxID=43041 RepID=A0A182K7G8_9DIPT
MEECVDFFAVSRSVFAGGTYWARVTHQVSKRAAHMRRASAELAERRRASLGATRGLRADGTLDPYHAAILFRDSRGAPHDYVRGLLGNVELSKLTRELYQISTLFSDPAMPPPPLNNADRCIQCALRTKQDLT